MTNISLNTGLLGQLYQPFETDRSNGGWNYENTAYFVSQGSEYQFARPSQGTSSTAPLTQDELNNVTSAVDTLVGLLNEIENPTQQILTWIADLTNWVKELKVNEPVAILTINLDLTHIRNNQLDDSATVSLVYAWVPALDAPLLISVNVNITWGGVSLPTMGTGVQILELGLQALVKEKIVRKMISALLFGDALPYVRYVFTFITVAAMGLVVIAATAKFLIGLGSDGGRANFLAVIVHAINRVTACIMPEQTSTATLSLPTLNLDGLEYTWSYYGKKSTIINNEEFILSNAMISGMYPGVPINNSIFPPGSFNPSGAGHVITAPAIDPFVYYSVMSPELSWSLTGAGMILSTKITLPKAEQPLLNEPYFAIALMIFTRRGELLQLSTFLQDGSGSSIVAPDPAAYPPSYLDMASAEYGYVFPLGEVIANSILVDAPSLLAQVQQLEWVIPEVMANCKKNIVLVEPPNNNWVEMPQPKSAYYVQWNLGPSYDSGQHPAIAIDNSGAVLQFHEGGSSNIYWDVAQRSGNTVTWNIVGKKRGGGDWPTVAMRDNGTFLEIHSGGTINLYWETGTASANNVSWDQSGGTYISDGNHPSVAMNSSNLVIVMFTQGNNSLQYNIGQLSGSGSSTSITWNATLVPYTSGDHASIVVNDNGCILEVHSNNDYLYFNIGTYGSSSITWKPNGPFYLYGVQGQTTGLALRDDGMVCLIYEYNNSLFYGLGRLDATNESIWWISLNNVIVGGAFPALTFASDGTLVETHQSSDSNATLWCDTGTIITP